MDMNDLQHDGKRVAAMKKLMVSIHPSNYPKNEDVQYLYEDVQTFYDACFQRMSEECDEDPKPNNRMKLRFRRTSSPNTVVDTVVQFNIRQKWPWLDGYLRPLSPDELTSGKTLAPLVAYQCINARGAIAHGKRPSLIYSWENAKSCTGLSVMDVFNKHGGVKTLTSGNIEDIKLEIIHHGPVVSFSFIPTRDFALDHETSIIKSRIKKHHYCLIVGWKLTEFGEVWLVQSYDGNEILQVPVGQYSIDQTILAPKEDFFHTCWQQGPYFDRDMSNYVDWHEYKCITLVLKSFELEEFAEILNGKGIHEAVEDKQRIVIRDVKKKALSRSCVLSDIAWDKDAKIWKLTCVFNGQTCHPLTPRVVSN